MTELLVILVVVVFFYGGRRISQLGDGIGRSITEFKKAVKKPDSEKLEQTEKKD